MSAHTRFAANDRLHEPKAERTQRNEAAADRRERVADHEGGWRQLIWQQRDGDGDKARPAREQTHTLQVKYIHKHTQKLRSKTAS